MIYVIIVGALISLVVFLIAMYFNFKQLNADLQAKEISEKLFFDQHFSNEQLDELCELLASKLITHLDNIADEQQIDNTKLDDLTISVVDKSGYIDNRTIVDIQPYLNKEVVNG